MIMTSRHSASTQKYLDSCNFLISVPKNNKLKYNLQFCGVSFPFHCNGQKGDERIYLGAAYSLQQK